MGLMYGLNVLHIKLVAKLLLLPLVEFGFSYLSDTYNF